MAAIQDLLNPLSERRTESSTPSSSPSDSSTKSSAPSSPAVLGYLPSPSSLYRASARASTPSPPRAVRKKQKLLKDRAVFTHGAIHGECRYPPFEYQDQLLEAQHQQFELHPIGQIADFARHIPYNSEKKMFESKTGRQWFEVFQYNFRIPGDEKVYCMMWDYNIGLVRTTPLFRSMGYSKTTPAKMLNRNPGLREICHSITGGSLVAQGYWMPYEAAKAIAATFCWKMRYALTPVFGLDFPDLCLPLDDLHYGDMILDHEITKRCTEEAAAYRLMEVENGSASARASPTLAKPLTPSTPTRTRPCKELRPKLSKLDTKPPSRQSVESSARHEKYKLTSNNDFYRNVWTPANTPRSIGPKKVCLQDSQDILASISRPPKRNADAMSDSSSGSSSPVSPKTHPKRKYRADEEYDGGLNESDGETVAVGNDGLADLRGMDGRLFTEGRMPSDERAAYLLMGLRLQRHAGESNSEVKLQQGRKRRVTV